MTAAATKPRFSLPDALSVAEDLVAELRPACERIEIAGSIRRKIQQVGDIELVAIPRFVAAEVDLFGSPCEPVDQLDHLLYGLKRDENVITDRLDKNGRPAWGPKFKRMRFAGVPVDLFSVTEETWGVIFTIRTGPADYSHQLVTHQGVSFRDAAGARRPGKLPRHMRVAEGRLYADDTVVWTPEEELFLEAIGEPYKRPWERK